MGDEGGPRNKGGTLSKAASRGCTVWFWRSSQRCLDQGPERLPVRRHQGACPGPLYVGDLANVRRKEINKEAQVWLSMRSSGRR